MNISGKLNPMHFNVQSDGERAKVTIFEVKGGYVMEREFPADMPIKEMLSKIKSEMFST